MPQRRSAIDRFETAVRDHEMRGARRPEAVPYIEKEYEEAKAHLQFILSRKAQLSAKRALAIMDEMHTKPIIRS